MQESLQFNFREIKHSHTHADWSAGICVHRSTRYPYQMTLRFKSLLRHTHTHARYPLNYTLIVILDNGSAVTLNSTGSDESLQPGLRYVHIGETVCLGLNDDSSETVQILTKHTHTHTHRWESAYGRDSRSVAWRASELPDNLCFLRIIDVACVSVSINYTLFREFMDGQPGMISKTQEMNNFINTK